MAVLLREYIVIYTVLRVDASASAETVSYKYRDRCLREIPYAKAFAEIITAIVMVAYSIKATVRMEYIRGLVVMVLRIHIMKAEIVLMSQITGKSPVHAQIKMTGVCMGNTVIACPEYDTYGIMEIIMGEELFLQRDIVFTIGLYLIAEGLCVKRKSHKPICDHDADIVRVSEITVIDRDIQVGHYLIKEIKVFIAIVLYILRHRGES
jgi:hypothetical protein